MSVQVWLAFVAATIVVVLIPGPTVLLVIGDALANRQRQAWSTVMGVGLGDGVAMALSLAGAGALLRASTAAFTVMKTLGGLYLLYLGVRSIVNARKNKGDVPLDGAASASQSELSRFRRAWTVTVLNPKSTLFFVAFVPQFISTKGSFVSQSAILLVTFVALAMLNASVYSSLARLIGRRLTTPSAQRKVGYAGGGTLIAAGTLTLALRRS